MRKALDGARTTRAWNGSEVARRTGVSRQTINRWVRGDWASDPEPERVAAFCGGLGLAPSAAFGILGWDRSATDRPAPAPAAALDPDIEALLRRLADPRVSDTEKFHIRETVRYLAHRPPLEIGRSTSRAPNPTWGRHWLTRARNLTAPDAVSPFGGRQTGHRHGANQDPHSCRESAHSQVSEGAGSQQLCVVSLASFEKLRGSCEEGRLQWGG